MWKKSMILELNKIKIPAVSRLEGVNFILQVPMDAKIRDRMLYCKRDARSYWSNVGIEL